MAFEIKIKIEVAGEEVAKWLDFKRVKPTRRAAFGDYISTLIEAVAYGDVVINKDFSITHNLNFPIKDKEGTVLFDKLTYAPRLTAGKISESLSGQGNNIDTTIQYGAALSGEGIGIIQSIDSTDLSILAAIGIFFST